MTPPARLAPVVSIASGRGFHLTTEDDVPVSRTNILPLAGPFTMQFQALMDLANFADSLEQAIGARLGAGAATQAAAPLASDWAITALNGHYFIEITPPAGSSLLPPVQHQIACANDQTFDVNSSSVVYTLGLGETSRDIVDPGATRYWRLRSRFPGSGWNAWRMYATAAGVTALNSGTLKTS